MSKFKFSAEDYNTLFFRLLPFRYDPAEIVEKIEEVEEAFEPYTIGIFEAQQIIECGYDPYELVKYTRRN